MGICPHHFTYSWESLDGALSSNAITNTNPNLNREVKTKMFFYWKEMRMGSRALVAHLNLTSKKLNIIRHLINNQLLIITFIRHFRDGVGLKKAYNATRRVSCGIVEFPVHI